MADAMGACRIIYRATFVLSVLCLAGCVYRPGTPRQSSTSVGRVDSNRIPASKPGLPDAVVDKATSGSIVTGEGGYTIQKGDTLAAISRKFYGDSKFWKTIYQANRDVIKNPNALEPGITINLP